MAETKRILVIPDVHGRKFWREPLEHIDKYEHVVFLGDYLDPYTDYEGITFDTALNEFHDILQLKIKYPDKITLLLGNHDLHYYWPFDMDCSRRSYDKLFILHKIYKSSRHLFQLAFRWDIDKKPYIFTHAGILSGWLDDNYNSLFEHIQKHINEKRLSVTLDWLNGMLDNEDFGILRQVSNCRGGFDDFGSPIWADEREHRDSEPLPGVFQVFGHTLMDQAHITDNYAMLDCRHAFELYLNNGIIKEYQ